MAKGDAYDLVKIVLMIIFTIIILFAAARPFFEQIVPKMEKEVMKISYGCTSNSDCTAGVCVNGECICFIDAQCFGGAGYAASSMVCDKSIGVCK